MARGKQTFSKSSGKSGWVQWLGLALILLLIDQFTKVLIVGNYRLGDSTFVTSFFNVVRVHNTGAAFSFLADAGGWQRWFFTGIGFVAAAVIIWMLRAHPGQKLFSFAMACILGGAIGNVIDRLMYGYVAPYEDKVPLNRNGFSPAVIPALGYKLNEHDSVQMKVLGTAGLMFSYGRRFWGDATRFKVNS